MRILLILAAAAIAGCGDIPVDVDCTAATGSITGHVTAGPVPDVVVSDLTVRGVAAQSDGLTIRTVTVAGIAAHNDGFNFDQWSAVVPISVLAGLPAAASGADDVQVAVEATDACGRTSQVDAFVIAVDRTPAVRIDRLALTADFPGGTSDADRFLPASGTASALVQLTANPDARGAAVTLSASFGTFAGVADGGGVTLAGDGTADATATVLFSAKRAGQAVITAGAKGVSAAPLTIDVAGPPTLLPSSADLTPGESAPVTVFSDAAVQSCQATFAQGLDVRSNGASIVGAPGGVDTSGDGRIDLVVVADAMAAAGASVTVTCTDRYGQSSTGTYDVVAP